MICSALIKNWLSAPLTRGIVILDKRDYIIEMERILVDRETYTVLRKDPSREYKLKLDRKISRGFKEGIVNKKERLFLIPSAPCTHVKYYLPEVHKNLTCPPGCLIVSGIDSVMSWVSKYIVCYLQPLVQRMPS